MNRSPHILLALALVLVPGAIEAQETSPPEETAAPAVKLSRLQGRARATRTKDVIGATVLVQRDDDRNRFYLTSSNGNGDFFVDRLSDGEYTVRLSREGYVTETKTGVELRYPFRAVVEVTMEAGTADLGAAGSVSNAGDGAIQVHGRVAGPDAEGLGEVWVRLVRQDGSVDPITLRTPDSGAFDLAGLPPGDWRLEVVGIGYLPLRQRLMLNSDSDLAVQLVKQPPDYIPAPLDLMPPEAPIAPEGFTR